MRRQPLFQRVEAEGREGDIGANNPVLAYQSYSKSSVMSSLSSGYQRHLDSLPDSL